MPRKTLPASPPVPTPDVPLSARAMLSVVLLLATGLLLWIFPLRGDVGTVSHWILSAAAVAASYIPSLRDRVAGALDRIRNPGSRAAWKVAALIAVAATAYLALTAWLQATDLVPKVVDESSYLIQARMLAGGRLWHAAHPPDVRPFFDTFNLLVSPVYGSMYFPGTGLLNTPAVAAGLPFWVTPLLLSGLCCGLMYRLFFELIDGVGGAVAALMLLGLSRFRGLSTMLFSQTPMLLLGLLLVLAYLRWRTRRNWKWTAIIGGLAGLAGITRPADALCYALPIGAAMLLDLRGQPRRVPALFTTLLVAAAPFLTLQLVQNIGMTGHWWEFPEARYADETYPAPMLGFFSVDPAAGPQPALPQKRALNESMVQPLYASHTPGQIGAVWWRERLPETLTCALPHPVLAVLAPVGLLGLIDRRRVVTAAVLLLFLSFYVFYVFYIPHYMIVIAPPMILLTLLGAATLARLVATRFPLRAASAGVLAALLPAALSLASLPELDGRTRDEDIFGVGFFHGESAAIDADLRSLQAELGPGDKALVLFHFDPVRNPPDEEPVYNTDVAWIDDARIIRAHDRGVANRVLYRYYAVERNEPDRVAYLYDRTAQSRTRLGTVGELARRK